jgi:hypothetical protein
MQRRQLIRFFGALAGALPLAGTAATRSRGPRTLPVLDAGIAGFAYYEGGAVIDRIATGDALTFRRELGNPHDRRAIEIFWSEHKIGYVPRSHNRALCQLLDGGEEVIGEVKRVDRGRWEPLFFVARVLV